MSETLENPYVLRVFPHFHLAIGVQEVGSSNLPAPTLKKRPLTAIVNGLFCLFGEHLIALLRIL